MLVFAICDIRNLFLSPIHEQIAEIKSYALYSQIIDTFNEIVSDEYYDAPLMLKYNTWRAMTMLDCGDIKGNFKFDDAIKLCETAADENHWRCGIQACVDLWLAS